MFHDSVYMYRVRIKSDMRQNAEALYEEVQVCAKFFLAVHGITGSKLQYLQKQLKMSGTAPKDRRGGVNYNKLKPDVLDTVRCHIQSFKARKSHYSLSDNSAKTYLPETLNITKMFSMFKDKYPLVIKFLIKHTERFLKGTLILALDIRGLIHAASVTNLTQK